MHRTLTLVFLHTQRKTRITILLFFICVLFVLSNCNFFVKLRRYTHKLTIFLSARADKSICGIDRTLFGRQTLGPECWTFARRIAFICAKLSPNFICGTLTLKRLVHILFSLSVEWENLHQPPPPLLSSCLTPLANCYCRCRQFCCSLLIIVCPPVATADFCRRNSCRHCRSLSWLLSPYQLPSLTTMRCPARVVVLVANRHHHCCSDVSSTTTDVVSWWLFPRMLPLTFRHGHDLLLRRSLFKSTFYLTSRLF